MFTWLKKILGIQQPEINTSSVSRTTEKQPEVDKSTASQPINKNEPNVDFQCMSKLEIDIWAKHELGLKLDRRRTREHMIQTIHEHLKKEN